MLDDFSVPTLAGLPSVVLWDIDGTLLRCAGVGVRAFAIAIRQVTGRDLVRPAVDFGGRTDPDIGRILLEALDLAPEDHLDGVLAAVVAAYDLLQEELRAATTVMPGVQAAIAAFAQVGAHQSILTGNLRATAEHKLDAAGLRQLLHLDSGAYGSDHADRGELARLALERVAVAMGTTPRAADTWVIGDTPRDLACARSVGARCVLVATGTYSLEQLVGLGADAVLATLEDLSVGRLTEG